MLSTDSTQIYVAEADLDRVEKTRLIATKSLAEKYLYVCAADIFNEKLGTNIVKGDYPNCSECSKCVRTLLALDFLGVLDKYAERFDLKKYHQNREKYIFEVFRDYREDRFKNELRNLILSTGYQLDKSMKRQLARLERQRKINTAKGLIMSIIRRIF